MTPPKPTLRDTIQEQLFARVASDVPTSVLGRFGRTASTLVRAARAARRSKNGAADDPPELDADALASIVASVGELKGIAMKAGQLMSYIDVALPEELRDALSALQTHASPMPVTDVASILRRELGARAGELLDTLDPVPLAAASIGQVHRARLVRNGTAHEVVVKVQYPQVEDAIKADFRPGMVGTAIASMIYPQANVASFLAEARARFLEECDYLHEAAAQRRFSELLAGHPTLHVPEVWGDYCSRRVLTSQFVQGVSLDAFLASDPPQDVKDRVGEALFEFYVGSIFRFGLYNCDPHPGNFLFVADGRIALLDYGCTRAFDAAQVDAFAMLTRAVHEDRREALYAAFLAIGLAEEGRPFDFEAARTMVRAFYGPMLEDERRAIDLGEARSMRQMLDSKRDLMKLRVPGEFLFLFRIRFGLMSILARIGSRANWYRLEESYLPPRAS
jgi:predicted unusual protein kinase regulating ubiquinone biosynthesis (AarF/ABC1/UbiB family)